MMRFLICLSIVLTLTACSGSRRYGNDFLASAQPTVLPDTLSGESGFWQGNPQQVWARLQSLSPSGLTRAADSAQGDLARGWIDLAVISRQDGGDDARLIPALIRWRETHPDHPGNRLLPDSQTLQQLLNPVTPRHIAVLLPLQGPSARAGVTVRSGFLNAYYASARFRPTLKPAISFYDTRSGQPLPTLYQQALAAGADQIVGPLTREEVQQVSRISPLPAPVLTLNYLPPQLFASSPAIVQFGLAPEDEAIQLAAHARAEGYTRALLITPDDPWGQRVSQTLVGAFRAAGGEVVEALYFRKREQLGDDIAKLLKVIPASKDDALLPDEHRRQDVDVIFLLAGSADAHQIVPLLKYNFSGSLPILSVSTIYSGTPNPAADLDLDGVVFCDIPSILSSSGRLGAVGQDAFQLATRLQRLKALPDFPINGMTGRLTLDSSQRVFRHLTWMKMKNGRPQPDNR